MPAVHIRMLGRFGTALFRHGTRQRQGHEQGGDAQSQIPVVNAFSLHKVPELPGTAWAHCPTYVE